MDSDTYWLNATNIALGVVTAIAVLAILRGVAAQFFSRRSQKDLAEEETEL